VDELLQEIISDASAALTKKNFEESVDRIHRRVHIIEQRIKRFDEMQHWSQVDWALERTKDEV